MSEEISLFWAGFYILVCSVAGILVGRWALSPRIRWEEILDSEEEVIT